MPEEPLTQSWTATTADAPVQRDAELAGAALLDRLGGLARTPEELRDYLDLVVATLRQEVTACEVAAVTVHAGPAPARAVSPAQADAAAPGGTAYASVLAVPLVSSGETVGALELYAGPAEAFDDRVVAVVRVAARRCADTVAAAQEIMRSRALAAQLEQAMESRAVIEQAKGLLIGLRGTSAQEAFEILRKESQDRNIRVRDLAERIVATAQAASGTRRATG